MKLFVIRHAQTEVNVTGNMVKDYDKVGILPFNTHEWWQKVGCNLPEEFDVYTSPVLRARETAAALFPSKKVKVFDRLGEIDCSALGDKKFWELEDEEFETLTGINRDKLNDYVEDLLFFLNNKYQDGTDKNVVLVTHGFTGRAMANYWEGSDLSALDILKSEGFEFANLDMYSVKNACIQGVWKFQKPFKRG